MVRVFTSPYPDVEIPNTTLTQQVFRHAGRLADRIAVVDSATGHSYTYGELHDSVQRLAGGLGGLGFGRGDVLAILSPNLAEYAVVFHAVATLGGTVTTVNPTYTESEIRFQLKDSRARWVVTIPMFVETVAAAAGAVGIDEVIVIGEAEGFRLFTDLMASDPLDGEIEISPHEDVVALPYSSGTTGLPKGVQLTHRNLVANLVQYEAISTVDSDDVILAVLPFFHIYGMQILMNGVLHRGAKAVTMPRFDLEEFLSLIEEHRVTRVAVVPPIVVALAKSPLVEQYDLSSLVQVGSGAAPLSAEVEDEAMRRTGAPVVQGFGLTETSPVTHAMPPDQTRTGSIGVPVPNTLVRLVHPETGTDLGVGEDGEMLIKGPQVMKGYLRNKTATEASIDSDGWFHTGDVCRVDEDGYWYVTDRIKELIKHNGFQVAPAELEALLLTHPGVADAAVIGLPDHEAGEVPKAFVVVQAGEEITSGEIMDFVAGRVASYKEIRCVEFIDAIPKSLAGKILRRVLRDREAGDD